MKTLRVIIRETIQLVENIQQADKIYFNKGLLSPRVREVIMRITGGDVWTKLLTDIYYAEMMQWKKTGHWMLAGFDGDDHEPEPEEYHKPGEDDVMIKDDWKRMRQFHNQLKEYNKNVFPIKGLNINGVKDVWGLIRALKERALILEEIKKLPSIALRNMKDDIRQERTSPELKHYRDRLEYFLHLYSLLSNREGRIKATLEKKMFKSNITIEDLVDFADEKENLIGGKKLNKASIKKIINENSDELEVVYDKGNTMIVDVTGEYGMKALGCNSVWCFAYGPGVYRNKGDWYNNSTNNHVYVIIDFSEPSDSPDFMYVLIKPLDFKSESNDENGDEENSQKMADMANNYRDNPISIISDIMSLEDAYQIMSFGEDRVGPHSEWPYQDPNQLKLDLKEIKKMIREAFIDAGGNLTDMDFQTDKINYPSDYIEKFVDSFIDEYSDYMNKQGWNIFDSTMPALFDKYNTNGTIWQVQVVDEPEEFYDDRGNALIGITTDAEAWKRAKNLGLMLDNLGAVIGYDGKNFLESVNENKLFESENSKVIYTIGNEQNYDEVMEERTMYKSKGGSAWKTLSAVSKYLKSIGGKVLVDGWEILPAAIYEMEGVWNTDVDAESEEYGLINKKLEIKRKVK